MKKETIFRHELNESIQADAAMNCLRNRNKHKQINEVAPVGDAAGRMLLPMLRPVITKLVQKALVKIGTHARPTQVITLVMDMLTKGEFAKKMAEKCGQTWNEIPSDVKKEIQDAIIAAFKKQAPQEQEESADEKDAFALKLVKKFKNRMTPDYAKRPEMFMMLKLQKALKKPLMSLSKEEYHAWAKAICDACESVFGSTQEQEELTVEQEEDTLNAYYSQDEPDYENDHHGIWLIINLMRKKGMLRAQGIEGRDNVDDGHAIDAAYDLIEQKLNDEGMWIGDDDHEAERFVSFFGEEIAEEAMKSAIHNQEQEELTVEQEELPQMERRDMILALSEYMSESWIDTGDDGDLDDIYYAIAEILDETGDYPESTDWEDCKPWCQKHYKEVESRIQ